MPLTPSFSIAPTTPNGSYIFTDTSTGSDVLITNRLITLNLVSGTTLTTISFPLSAGSSVTVTLAQDYCLNCVIQWLSAGNTVLYQSAQIFPFTQIGELFFYGLIQAISTSPPNYILQDTLYLSNFYKLRALLDATPLAINVGGDLSGGQGLVAQYQFLIQNAAFAF